MVLYLYRIKVKQCTSPRISSFENVNKIESGLPIYSKRLTENTVKYNKRIDWQERLYKYGEHLSKKDILASIVNGTIIFWSMLLLLSVSVAGFMRYGVNWLTYKLS